MNNRLVNLNPQNLDEDALVEPIWVEKKIIPKEISPFKLYVATPCHSEVSLHYVQSLLDLSRLCHMNKIHVEFCILKSSLVTQGRNLCVSGFLESKCTHMLFIDSDISIGAKTILKMLQAQKELISVPYPLKAFLWDKGFDEIAQGNVKKPKDLEQIFNSYPMKVADKNDILLKDGIIEITHAPTGCMLINRSVFDKLIEKYPEREIKQNTVINSKLVLKKHMWNFFDTLHDPKEKTYLGEDFAFCKLWKDIGGKCYAYILDEITHVGEHQYTGKFVDELILDK
tara:strand:- start:586 stop:1437 length:852 start_codon:yes stop_codon:yes gene_type:complete